jgi:hypothetical protein
MSSSAWTGNSAIFIAWDESEFANSGFGGFGDDSVCCDAIAGQGGGHVVTLACSFFPRDTRAAHLWSGAAGRQAMCG